MTHHSVEPSHDGSFWVPAYRSILTVSPFPMLTPPYKEDYILKVAPDGKILAEMSVLKLLFDNGLRAQLFANGDNGSVIRRADLTHLNDVEELSPQMAARFPRFAAGDLLLSLRNMNLLLVVDPATWRVKWHQTGPWMDQHDPDFLPNGRISVFSNNNDGTEAGSPTEGSTIIEVDPASGESRVRYGGRPDQRFYTSYRGKQQALPNGNLLIVEAHAGRVIEVAPDGGVVWEFLNRYDDTYAALVIDAIRYPPGYFKVEDWACGK